MQNNDPHVPDPAQDGGAADSEGFNADLDAVTAKLTALEAELRQARVKRSCASGRKSRTSAAACSATWIRPAASPTRSCSANCFRSTTRLVLGLANESAETKTLREGLELTLKQLEKVTQGNGLTVVNPLHQPFNPEQHQAISSVESNEHPPGTVVAVVQKGFVLNDRLLRPALVAVVRDN